MTPRPPPKVLLLDIGDVVVWDPRPRIVREIIRREKLAPARVRTAYYRAAHRMAEGSIRLTEAYSRLSRSLRWSMSYTEFRELVSNRALAPVPGVLPALRTLHPRGRVRIIYASNVERVTWEGLRRKFHLDRYADAAVLSYRIGSMKPARRFYREALRVGGASGEETLFLDNLPENVRGARAMGIRSRTVRAPRDTLSVLRRLARANPPSQ